MTALALRLITFAVKLNSHKSSLLDLRFWFQYKNHVGSSLPFEKKSIQLQADRKETFYLAVIDFVSVINKNSGNLFTSVIYEKFTVNLALLALTQNNVCAKLSFERERLPLWAEHKGTFNLASIAGKIPR